MLTISSILGATPYDTLPAEHKANLKALFAALHELETDYGKPLKVSSGYRTPEHNAAIGGAKHSNHLIGKACDFSDLDGSLDAWCSAHQDLLASLGLWQEHPESTKNWCHLDIAARPALNRPKCGKRQFLP